MDTLKLVQNINNELAIDMPAKLSQEELQIQLAAYFNDLIKNNFEKLIAYLYRIDISEQKLKSLLQELPQQDAGKIIAALVIERQLQKIKSRELFRQQETDFDEEEKW